MKTTTRFQLYKGHDGKWYWRCWRGGNIVGDGSQGYATKYNAKRALWSLINSLNEGNVIVEYVED